MLYWAVSKQLLQCRATCAAMPMPTHVNGKAVKTGSWTPHEDSLLAEWQSILGNRYRVARLMEWQRLAV